MDSDNDDEKKKMSNTSGGSSGSSSTTMDPLLNMRLSTQMIIASKRCSGKSQLIQSLVYHLAKSGRLHDAPTTIVCFCGTKDASDDYTWLPPENVRKGWSEQQAMKLLQFQMKRINLLRRQATRANATVKLPHLLFLMDDVIGLNNVNTHTSPCLRMIATSGRHYGISTIMSLQSATQISPTLRQNTDAIICGNLTVPHLKHIHECTQGKSWKDFLKFIGALEEYEFCFYDNVSPGNLNRFHVVKALDFPKKRFFIRNKQKEKPKPKKAKQTQKTSNQ
jgi:hypothetical protein